MTRYTPFYPSSTRAIARPARTTCTTLLPKRAHRRTISLSYYICHILSYIFYKRRASVSWPTPPSTHHILSEHHCVRHLRSSQDVLSSWTYLISSFKLLQCLVMFSPYMVRVSCAICQILKTLSGLVFASHAGFILIEANLLNSTSERVCSILLTQGVLIDVIHVFWSSDMHSSHCEWYLLVSSYLEPFRYSIWLSFPFIGSCSKKVIHIASIDSNKSIIFKLVV